MAGGRPGHGHAIIPTMRRARVSQQRRTRQPCSIPADSVAADLVIKWLSPAGSIAGRYAEA
jgi:hypothetical protein